MLKFFLSLGFLSGAARAQYCGKVYDDGSSLSRDLSEYEIPHDNLPSEMDWRKVNSTNYVTAVGYQMLPSLCGSCWRLLSCRRLLHCRSPVCAAADVDGFILTQCDGALEEGRSSALNVCTT